MNFRGLSLLILAQGSALAAAFVPRQSRASWRPMLGATLEETALVKETENALNQELFLEDMIQELPNLNWPPPQSDHAIPAEPAYITESRLRMASLAARSEALREHYATEIHDRRTHRVGESKSKNKNEGSTLAPVETDTTNLLWNLGAIAVAVAVVAVDPATVTDFMSNLDLNIDLPNVNLDWTAIQKVQADVAILLDESTFKVQDLLMSAQTGLEALQSQTQEAITAAQIGLETTQADFMRAAGDAQARAAASVEDLQTATALQLEASKVVLTQVTAQLQSESAHQLEGIQQVVSKSQNAMEQVEREFMSRASIWKDEATNVKSGLFSSAQLLAEKALEKTSAAVKTVEADWTLAGTNFRAGMMSAWNSAGEKLKVFWPQ